MNEEKIFPYEDIIGLPHHVSMKHRPMERQNRAAQFAPFAALTGFGAAITETARLTDGRPVPDEDKKEELDRRLALLLSLADNAPLCTVTYFRKDERKEGGSFASQTGRIHSLDTRRKTVVMDDKSEIPAGDIVAIDSDIFNITGDPDRL